MCFIILQNTHGIITKMSWIFYNSKIYNNLEFKLTVFGLWIFLSSRLFSSSLTGGPPGAPGVKLRFAGHMTGGGQLAVGVLWLLLLWADWILDLALAVRK